MSNEKVTAAEGVSGAESINRADSIRGLMELVPAYLCMERIIPESPDDQGEKTFEDMEEVQKSLVKAATDEPPISSFGVIDPALREELEQSEDPVQPISYLFVRWWVSGILERFQGVSSQNVVRLSTDALLPIVGGTGYARISMKEGLLYLLGTDESQLQPILMKFAESLRARVDQNLEEGVPITENLLIKKDAEGYYITKR